MPVSVPVLTPLSFDEKETVRLTLEDNDLKIYAVASVALSYIRGTQNLSILKNLRGALVLFRNTITRQCNLQLIDLRDMPGTVVWRHELSTLAELAEVKEADEERTYVLTDAELRVNLVFADDVEASKLSTKFIRSIHRAGASNLDTDIGRLYLDDDTVRRVETGTDRGMQRDAETQDCSDGLFQSSTTLTVQSEPVQAVKDQPSLTNAILDGEHNVIVQQHSSHSELPSTGTDTWIFTIHERTYRIPDLTGSLASVDEIEYSDTKYKGGFGVVRRARLSNGEGVAIKTLLTRSEASCNGEISKGMKERRRFRNEAAMQSMLSHPNVLPLLGIAEAEAFGLGASLVLPWMTNADSLRYVQNNPQVLRLPLILGTIRGVAFLHSKGVVHGDIKARNILISDERVPLLCDFGLTSFVDVHEHDHELSTSIAIAGSWAWMAPELRHSESPGSAVTRYSDMWAFAMTVVELLTGAHPFTYKEVCRMLRLESQNLPPRPQNEECTDGLWDFVRSCWAEESTSRPAADEALRIIHVVASSFAR